MESEASCIVCYKSKGKKATTVSVEDYLTNSEEVHGRKFVQCLCSQLICVMCVRKLIKGKNEYKCPMRCCSRPLSSSIKQKILWDIFELFLETTVSYFQGIARMPLYEEGRVWQRVQNVIAKIKNH